MSPETERSAALSLMNAAAVRERAHELLVLALGDRLAHFAVDLDRLAVTAHVVAEKIRVSYPQRDVPFHARWRHFVVDGIDLWAQRAEAAAWASPAARARAAFDLAIVSVLLDAGAGTAWHYLDPETGLVVGRSEGLALASLRMFEAGTFSAHTAGPLRADASRLVTLTEDDLARGLQVMESNPLVGLSGRAELLARLGAAVAANPKVFGLADAPRPGGLYDHLVAEARGGVLPAPRILEALLLHLAPVWPSRITLGGLPLGDCWRHPAIKRGDATDGLVPLHKLSQWLAYSLIEPLQWAGIRVTEIDGLTGLAEYRNGGLFVDSGVLALREPDEAYLPQQVDSPLVVEWRALTVALLDRIAPLVREELGVSAEDFPLARVLEGGTWSVGRGLARDKRPDAGPPIAVVSDGTVF